jgi:hypothetical protein
LKAGTVLLAKARLTLAAALALAFTGLWTGSAGAQFLGAPKTAASKTPAPQKPIPPLTAPDPAFTYPQHETLSFTVDWRVFTAGVAVFKVDQVGSEVRISTTADTVGAVNMLFPVVDRFQSGFDLKTGCSTGFHKQIQENRRKIATDLTFDYAHGRQLQDERNLVKGTATHKEANIPACVTDDMSAIFYTQSQTLTPGQMVSFPLADSMRTITVGMKVEAKEEIKTPAGTFQTVRVQATADEGVVKNRGSIWIWYTDDARHIPVQMQARLFFGTITFHLQSIDIK